MIDLVIEWMESEIAKKTPRAAALHMERVVKARKAGKDPICRGAPHLTVAYARKDDRTAPAACTIALTYLDVVAPAMGLGTCWAGLLHVAMCNVEDFAQELPLIRTHAHHYPLMVGYPAIRYHRLPERKPSDIEWL